MYLSLCMHVCVCVCVCVCVYGWMDGCKGVVVLLYDEIYASIPLICNQKNVVLIGWQRYEVDCVCVVCVVREPMHMSAVIYCFYKLKRWVM